MLSAGLGPRRLWVRGLETGHSVLLTLHLELRKLGISLRVTEARSSVRDLLRAEGLDEKVGPIDRFASVADLVENFQQQTNQPRSGK